MTSWGALEPARPPDHPDALRLEQFADRVVQLRFDARDAGPEGVEVEAAVGGNAHHLGPVKLGEEPAGGDHRLGRDAVPQMGGTTDEVALDQGDLGSEASGDSGGRVAPGATADDDEPDAHSRKAN